MVVVETGRGGLDAWLWWRLVEVELKFGRCEDWSISLAGFEAWLLWRPVEVNLSVVIVETGRNGF